METPLKVVASVTATDKYTVIFKLAYPTIDMQGILLENLPGNMVAAVGSRREVGDTNDWRRVVSTGPFMLTDFVSDAGDHFTRNPNYYGYSEWYSQNKLPYSDKWKVMIIPDVSTSLAGMRTGKIDIMQNLTWEQAASLAKTNPELVQAKLPQNGVTVDMRSDSKQLSDIKVRKALQMSVDLKDHSHFVLRRLCRLTLWGLTGTPGYMTPYDKWSQDLKDGYAYNPDGAKKLLADAGIPTGLRPT